MSQSFDVDSVGGDDPKLSKGKVQLRTSGGCQEWTGKDFDDFLNVISENCKSWGRIFGGVMSV